MNKILSVFYLTLLTFALAQDFAGGRISHFATGTVVIQSKDGIGIQEYNVILNGANFDANQLVHGATAIVDFGTGPTNVSPIPPVVTQYISFTVEDLTLNPSRTTFTIKASSVPSITGVNKQKQGSAIVRVTLSYILAGERMDNPTTSSTILSSSVYAKNSEIVSLQESVQTTTKRVSFDREFLDSSPGNKSPFLLDTSLAENKKCEARRDGDSWKLLTTTCNRAIGYTFITGFTAFVPEPPSSPDVILQIDRVTNTNKLGSQHFNLKTAGFFSLDRSAAGLPLSIVHKKAKAIQVSLVALLIKQYQSSTYPLQGISIDLFKVNSYLTSSMSSNQGQVTVGINTVTNSLLSANDETILAGNNYDKKAYGHGFFGLHYFKITADTSGLKRLQFRVGDIDLAQGKISVSAPSTNPPTVDNSIDTGSTKTNFDYTFLLFSLKTPCQDSISYILWDETQGAITIVATPKDKVTANLASQTQPQYDTLLTKRANLVGAVSPLFTQKFTGSGTVTYTFKTTQQPKNLAYQGVIYIRPPTLITETFENIEVTVFGNLVIRERRRILGEPIHFAFQNTNLIDNTVKITYNIQPTTGTTPFPNIDEQTVQFGLIPHSNVLAEDTLACVTACQPIPGYTVGINYATVPPTCVKCQTGIFLEFDPISGSCSCLPGYNSVNGKCQLCNIPLCETCSSASDNCPQCVANAIYINPASTRQGCTCIDGYYRDNLRCLSCSLGCVTCRNAQTCNTCKIPVGKTTNPTRKTPSQGCTCVDGFYETGSIQCAKCAPECLTCSTSATKCDSCRDNAKLSGTTCVCNDGYYAGIDANGVGTCLKCYFGCKTCSGDAAKCIDCKSQQWSQKPTGECVCNHQMRYVYYDNQIIDGICIDRKCASIHPNCAECYLYLNNGDRRCKKCNDLENWIKTADETKCQCMVGYFLNQTGNCQKCGLGCQQCLSPQQCIKCAQGTNSNVGGVCTCPASTFLKKLDNTLLCMPCDANCLQCQVQSNICTQCTNGFIANPENKCVCQGRKFATPDNVFCRDCLSGCQVCTNQTICVSCQNGYLPNEDKTQCLLDCPIGLYNAGPKCDKCPIGCKSCTSLLDCRDCITGYNLYLGSCRETCPTGTFAHSSKICIACSQACKTCAGSPTACTDCANGLISYNGNCLANCPDRLYYNGQTCLPCSTNCAKCQAQPDRCTECPANQFLYQNKCSTTCPTAIVGGVCTNICPDGQFLAGTRCVPCSPQCRTCSAANVCTSCKGAALTYKGNCVASCPPGNTLRSGTSCLDCDASCVGCSGSVTTCIKCQTNFFRLDTFCISACPQRFYADQASQTCRPCDSGCQICTSSGFCSKCIDNSVPNLGVCQGNCGQNCIQCVDNVCTRCAQGFVPVGSVCRPRCPAGAVPVTTASGTKCVCSTGLALHFESCVATCPDGFVKIGDQCRTCKSPCKTCSTAIDSCNSCVDGYTYDQVSKKCVENNGCAFGQYPSAFGQCRFICPEGSFYFDSACYFGRCPIGFVKNDNRRTCTKSTIDAGCSVPLFLQGQNCVSRCDQGFYPNLNNRVCQVCPTNCLSCTRADVCESCNAGTSLQNNVCVTSTDLCPPNQNRYNEACVNVCPQGTFPMNGFCIRICNSGLFFHLNGCYETCPTNLNTAEACVVVCPVGQVPNSNRRCVPSNSQGCTSSQFINPINGACENCRYPCASCAGTATFCTNCAPGFILNGGSCISQSTCPPGSYPSPSGGCLRCPAKCSTCTSQNRCTGCAAGFVNTGADCIPGSSSDLRPFVLQLVSVVRSGNLVLIQIKPNIMPNGIPSSLSSNLLLLIASFTNVQVNIWVDAEYIYVGINFLNQIPVDRIILVPNVELLHDLFNKLGYTLVGTQLQVGISPNLQQVNRPNMPVSLYSQNSRVFNSISIKTRINSNLNSEVLRSIQALERLK